jgi:hypothetical protein
MWQFPSSFIGQLIVQIKI